MKSKCTDFHRSRRGGVSISFLLITFALGIVVASYFKLTSHNAWLDSKAIEHQRARIAAQSALDCTRAQLSTAVKNGRINMNSPSLQTELNSICATIKPGFVSDNGAFEIVTDAFAMIVRTPTNWVSLRTDEGGYRDEKIIEVVVGVSNTATKATAAIAEEVLLTREPFLRYAIFFDDTLELHPGPDMTVQGKMRSNNNIELWCGSSLKLQGKVLTPKRIDIVKSDELPAWSTDAKRNAVAPLIEAKKRSGTPPVLESFYQDNAVLDSRHPLWTPYSEQVWKTKVRAGPEVAPLIPPFEANNHALIERKDAADSPQLIQEKLAYKADVIIKIDAFGNFSAEDASGTPIALTEAGLAPGPSATNGFYTVTNSGCIKVHTDFYDPRESQATYDDPTSPAFEQMQMVDIYTDKLLALVPNAEIVYIQVDERVNPTDPKPAVRLRNGHDLYSAGVGADGITFATDRSMYVEGDFNCPRFANGSQYQARRRPVLLAADNLTLLSNGWDDSNADDPATDPWRPGGAKNTALNAAVMIGYADPDGGGPTPTGGAHNLVRFREDWGGIDFDFRGALISLWTAEDSNCIYHWKFYAPPNRNIRFDYNFNDTEPPGAPQGYTGSPVAQNWREISMEDAKKMAQ